MCHLSLSHGTHEVLSTAPASDCTKQAGHPSEFQTSGDECEESTMRTIQNWAADIFITKQILGQQYVKCQWELHDTMLIEYLSDDGNKDAP